MPYKVFIQINTDDEELKNLYISQINKMKNNEHNEYNDSCFDLYIPDKKSVFTGDSILIDLNIKCAVYKYDKSNTQGLLGINKLIPSAYYLYPRSSISKTKLRLSNSVGIIDSGYRGNLMIALDNINKAYDNIIIDKGQRLVQICMPDLSSDFTVEIIDKLNDTKRGDGGFGSTGK